jgi:hypothetical protein
VVRDRRPAGGESREDVRPERSILKEFERVVDANGRALDSDKAIRPAK